MRLIWLIILIATVCKVIDAEENCESFCLPGWKAHKNACYQFKRNLVTFERAVERCHFENASLVSVLSKDESEFIRNLINGSDRYWLGLKRNWPFLQWMDDETVGFKNFKTSVLLSSRNHCVISKGGNSEWELADCDGHLATYVCKYRCLKRCHQSFTPFANACYMFKNSVFTRKAAKYYCHMFRATLTSIGSREEELFINGLAKDRDSFQPIEYWTGLENYNGSWKWEDGSPFVYENWRDLSGAYNNTKAMYMIANNKLSQWVPVEDDEKFLKTLICKYSRKYFQYKPLAEFSDTNINDTPVTPAPINWEKYPSSNFTTYIFVLLISILLFGLACYIAAFVTIALRKELIFQLIERRYSSSVTEKQANA